ARWPDRARGRGRRDRDRRGRATARPRRPGRGARAAAGRVVGAGAALRNRRDGEVRGSRLVRLGRCRDDGSPPDPGDGRAGTGRERGEDCHRDLRRMTVRIGFKTSPQDVDWPTLDATWARAGELGVFDSGWLNDHLTNMDAAAPGPSFEALTLLAGLVHHVPGITVGHAVLSNTFR